MRVIANNDAYADALSTAAIATVPFIAIGMLDHPVVFNVALSLGILLSCAFLVRFFYLLRKNAQKNPDWVSNLMSLLQIPYVFCLTGLILLNAHIEDASIILWISLGLAFASLALLPLVKNEY